MTRLLVIAGPTASGKTASALALARALDGELVGADSVQVYRGFDIGSAKPTAEELGGIPHHLLDVLDPDGFIDAVIYAELADAAISEVARRGRLPIVVGGTGLWIRALVRGLLDVPPPDAVVRASLEAEVRASGSPALHARLAAVDPLAAAAIHENDAFRVVRAMEIYLQTGVPAGTLRAQHALGAPRYETFFATLGLNADELLPRIEARTDAMIADGWIDEVRGLLARWPRSARAFGSVGYRQIVAHLCDDVPMDETHRRIVKATRVYARRQRTWFAGEPSVDGHPGCVDWRGRPEALTTDTTLAALRRWRDAG